MNSKTRRLASDPPGQPARDRITYALAALLIVGMGLLWRSRRLPLTPFLVKYGGDALWAAMVYAIVRFFGSRKSVWVSAGIAFAIAVMVELSQLYHAPWIDAIRSWRLGAAVLGSTFNAPDIPAYAVGVAAVAALDCLRRRQ